MIFHKNNNFIMEITLIIISLLAVVSLFYFWNANTSFNFTEVKTHQNNSSTIISNVAGNNAYNSVNHPLITEVYYDTYLPYDPDEYVRIYNPSQSPANISNWQITDLENITIIPDNTFLGGNASVYVARNGTAFYEENLFLPDFEMLDSNTSIKNMSGSQLQLSNTADEVILKDANGTIIDAVAYANSSYRGTGWSSSSVKKVAEGTILRRNVEEQDIGERTISGQNISGQNVGGQNSTYIDTDTSADWEGGRVFRIRQSNFPYPHFTYTGNLTVFVSPDSSFGAITSEIDSAKATIRAELYEITSNRIAEHLINATKRGVKVSVLLEGNPVGWNISNVDFGSYSESRFGEPYTQKYLLTQLYNAGAEIRFMITDKGMHARYNNIHCKYLLFDSERTLITTENLKPSSFPQSGEYGNRGWGVVIDDRNTTEYLTAVFLDDWNISKKDIREFSLNDTKWGAPPSYFHPDISDYANSSHQPKFKSETYYGTYKISVVLSPDSSSLDSSIIDLIKSASSTIYAEQLYSRTDWGERENAYLQSVFEAAKRGVEAKILLDSKYVNQYDAEEDNLDAVAYIDGFSKSNNLPNLDARLAYLENLSKIHAKGVVVDGNKTLVSSINWNYASVMENREAGVIIENTAVADYFTRVFAYDWNLTLSLNNLFDILLIDREVAVSPGGEAEIYVHIKNKDVNERAFNLMVTGTPSGWSIFQDTTATPLRTNRSVIKSIIIKAPLNASIGDKIEFRIYGSTGGDTITYVGRFVVNVCNASEEHAMLAPVILASISALTISICIVIAVSLYRDKLKGRR